MNHQIKKLKKLLKENVSKEIFIHSVSVMEEAIRIAKIYQADIEKAAVAGLLHDCARDFTIEQLLEFAENFNIKLSLIERHTPSITHAQAGAILAAKKYAINDTEILEAIKSHTLGKTNMSLLEKIIFIADAAEPLRDYPDVKKIRKMLKVDINRALLMCFDNTIQHVIERGLFLHPLTVDARNNLIQMNRERQNYSYP